MAGAVVLMFSAFLPSPLAVLCRVNYDHRSVPAHEWLWVANVALWLGLLVALSGAVLKIVYPTCFSAQPPAAVVHER